MSTIKEFYYFLIWSYKTSGVTSLFLFVFANFLTTQVSQVFFCPGRFSCLPLLLSINLWQLQQQQHVDIMNLLLFKYFIFVMALAGDDSTQYTILLLPYHTMPHPNVAYLFLFFVICFRVGVRNYLWACLGKFRPQLDSRHFSVTGSSSRSQLPVTHPEFRAPSL